MAIVTISDPGQLKKVVIDILRENPELLDAAIKELFALENNFGAETPEARNHRKTERSSSGY